jgi:hypothetical protein
MAAGFFNKLQASPLRRILHQIHDFSFDLLRTHHFLVKKGQNAEQLVVFEYGLLN